jgi:hypothetical protein
MMTGERRRTVGVVAVVVIAILVLGVVYTSSGLFLGRRSSSSTTSSTASSSALSTSKTSSSATSSIAGDVNLLANGGFETGNLSGWSNSSDYRPIVGPGEGNATFAATFETPANGQDLTLCTTYSAECGSLNVSTISQRFVVASVNRQTSFSFAMNPKFSYPAGLQITLSFLRPSDPDAQNATIFYLFYASPQQCENYTQILAGYNTFHTSIYCLTVPQGEWTTMTRNIASDLASTVGPAYLDGSTLTLSFSFAGGNSTDKTSIGSVFFG